MGKSKGIVYPMRFSDEDVAKLEEHQKGLGLDNYAQTMRFLIHRATVVQAPKVSIDTAILQPPATAQVEDDGDMVWA